LVACKSNNCQNNWYANPSQVELAMHKRLRRSVSNKPVLKYFDGRTMQSYQEPTFGWEVSFCRQNPAPDECSVGLGYSTPLLNYLSMDESFEIKYDNVEKQLNLYSKIDIPKMSTFLIDDTVMQISDQLKKFDEYLLPFGSLPKALGGRESTLARSYISIVASSVQGECSFANVEQFKIWKDGEVKPGGKSEGDTSTRTSNNAAIFNPLLDRHLSKFETGLIFRAVSDISKGDVLCANVA